MAAAPDRLLLRLEWTVLRRLEGRLQGAHRTAHRGSGIDFAGLREYLEGDDARHIDWNVTARLGDPQVRVFAEDRELTLWLVFDTSASMGPGAPGRGKAQVAAELGLALARLFGDVEAAVTHAAADRVVVAAPASPRFASGTQAAVLLAGAGGADNVSSIFRGTMLQTAAPDSVRGRLQGVFIVVVTGGPRVGDLYAGVLAATGLLFLPPLAGGVVIIALVALLVRRRGFLAYDARSPAP